MSQLVSILIAAVVGIIVVVVVERLSPDPTITSVVKIVVVAVFLFTVAKALGFL
jgi:FtsH-binding integral membrane protein